jgi:hypothetical protein
MSDKFVATWNKILRADPAKAKHLSDVSAAVEERRRQEDVTGKPLYKDLCPDCGALRGMGTKTTEDGKVVPCVCASREFVRLTAHSPGFEHWKGFIHPSDRVTVDN